jgi:hypothetical protein
VRERWRSRKDTHLHLLCEEGSEAFESLPVAIRNLGPWTGGPEGEVERLRLPYRILLVDQGFVVIHQHVSALQLEAADVRALQTANAECPNARAAAASPCTMVYATKNPPGAAAKAGSRGRQR